MVVEGRCGDNVLGLCVGGFGRRLFGLIDLPGATQDQENGLPVEQENLGKLDHASVGWGEGLVHT